jgi:hypothetical protein
MPRKMLFTAALIISTAVFGQGQSTNQSTSPAPVNGPFGGPILVTPSASFPSPAPAAGISNAGQAGISNAGQTGISVETNSMAPVEAVAAPSGATVTGSESNSALPPESGNTAANDLMPSTSMSGAGVSEAAAPGAVSLAEISSRYKAEKGARNARVLGNDDVEKMLANKGGVTMAKNMPPLGPGVLEQGGQPQTAGAQMAATSGGRQSASANQQAGTPPAQSTAPDTSAENSTTPRVNQNQQSNDAQGSRRLPATGGFLPLLGLLGLASGGIGFWFRKFRK